MEPKQENGEINNLFTDWTTIQQGKLTSEFYGHSTGKSKPDKEHSVYYLILCKTFKNRQNRIRVILFKKNRNCVCMEWGQ